MHGPWQKINININTLCVTLTLVKAWLLHIVVSPRLLGGNQSSNTFTHHGSCRALHRYQTVTRGAGHLHSWGLLTSCGGGWWGLEWAPTSGPIIDRSGLHTKKQDKNCFVALIWISMPSLLLLLSWPYCGHLSEQKQSPWKKYEQEDFNSAVHG